MKLIAKIILLLLIVVIVGGLGGYLYWQGLLSPVNTQDQQVQTFVVEKGEGVVNIAQQLEQKKLIKSALAFNIMVKLSRQGDLIQAGDFQISPAMSARQIFQQLTAGIANKGVTLLEGWRVEEMAQKLNADLGIDQTSFISQAQEGYMFPDTYLFKKDSTIADIVATMENNFQQKYTPALQHKITNLGLTPAEGVILASIVEREARSNEARTMVASILLKRLRIGMALNTDATIQYALGYQPSQKSWWKKDLTAEDLKVNSPYNTYLYPGLPPGPICNPSLSSLEAVANADPNTPYLYYYHDSQGNSHYAKTLEEHNQNVANYP
ncbi:endolytic transglycosylase MltG [Patescibacteria group bacterium]|nr:endolytic transglycosylase MltG [Patescibacteria group bacterium]MCL5410023.1 endolytic transglycosylase MltG [Patescibacteria group bacterium]